MFILVNLYKPHILINTQSKLVNRHINSHKFINSPKLSNNHKFINNHNKKSNRNKNLMLLYKPAHKVFERGVV